jgi:hypothetical protein
MLAGCPKPNVPVDGEKFDLGSFTEWDQLIRGCLLWLGYADPLVTQEGIEDPMKGNDLQILAAWHDMWGEEEHTINEIGRSDQTELHQALRGGRKDWDPGVVAHKLRKLRDRVLGKYKLVKTADSSHGAKYIVRYLGKTPSPSKESKQRAKKPKKWESKIPPREG